MIDTVQSAPNELLKLAEKLLAWVKASLSFEMFKS